MHQLLIVGGAGQGGKATGGKQTELHGRAQSQVTQPASGWRSQRKRAAALASTSALERLGPKKGRAIPTGTQQACSIQYTNARARSVRRRVQKGRR